MPVPVGQIGTAQRRAAEFNLVAAAAVAQPRVARLAAGAAAVAGNADPVVLAHRSRAPGAVQRATEPVPAAAGEAHQALGVLSTFGSA